MAADGGVTVQGRATGNGGEAAVFYAIIPFEFFIPGRRLKGRGANKADTIKWS